MQEIFLTVRYFERGLSKSLKRVTLFFLLNPVSFNRQNRKNQKEPGTRDQLSSRYKTSSEKFFY